MRRWAAVLGGGVAIGGAFVACSSFSGDSAPPPIEAGVEAAPPSDAGVDSGELVATPGLTECPGGTQVCDTINGLCCFDTDSGIGSCKKDCVFGVDDYIRCDDSADCAPGQRCCLQLGSTACTTTTKCDSDQFCRTTAECPPGEACLARDCVGRRVGICGAPSTFIADFCARDR
jgi:hypothetical protein